MSEDSKTVTLAELMAKYESRLDAGGFSPLAKRISDDGERFKAWMELTKARGHRYALCKFENYKATNESSERIKKAVMDFAERMPDCIQDGSGLVLIGPPGTGKDHLMMAAMRSAVLKHGYTVEWHDGLRLYHEMRKAIAEHSTEKMLRDLVQPQILALSDPLPPRDELSEYELDVLRDLVERRYSRQVSTWVTTNVDNPEEARRLFTDAILDRLGHGAHQHHCNWPSYRTGAK